MTGNAPKTGARDDLAGEPMTENANSMDYAKILRAAINGTLPPNFDKWALTDSSGDTLAHIAVTHRRSLPSGFRRWEMKDRFGRTVAHVAAMRGVLPDDFSRWGLQDDQGETVAEYVLKHARNFKDFPVSVYLSAGAWLDAISRREFASFLDGLEAKGISPWRITAFAVGAVYLHRDKAGSVIASEIFRQNSGNKAHLAVKWSVVCMTSGEIPRIWLRDFDSRNEAMAYAKIREAYLLERLGPERSVVHLQHPRNE
jgi:hypothetical protein